MQRVPSRKRLLVKAAAPGDSGGTERPASADDTMAGGEDDVESEDLGCSECASTDEEDDAIEDNEPETDEEEAEENESTGDKEDEAAGDGAEESSQDEGDQGEEGAGGNEEGSEMDVP